MVGKTPYCGRAAQLRALCATPDEASATHAKNNIRGAVRRINNKTNA